MVHFIPTTKDVNAIILTNLIFDEVIKYYNISKPIVSDKRSIFIFQ